MSATTRRLSWSERRLVTPLLRLLVGRLGLDTDQVRVLEVRGATAAPGIAPPQGPRPPRPALPGVPARRLR
jgi:hypothetical protein